MKNNSKKKKKNNHLNFNELTNTPNTNNTGSKKLKDKIKEASIAIKNEEKRINNLDELFDRKL